MPRNPAGLVAVIHDGRIVCRDRRTPTRKSNIMTTKYDTYAIVCNTMDTVCRHRHGTFGSFILIFMAKKARKADKQRVRTAPIQTPLNVELSSGERLRAAAKKLFAQQGFENTSTAEICRLASTSQSQLVSHFGSKNGILEAIFNDAWLQLTPAVRLAAGSLPSAKQKLSIASGMVLSFLSQDPDLLTIFLLEGRRMRGQGQGVYLAPAFLQFVSTLDEIIQDLEAQNELQPDVHPQALRSALMGAFEGLVRDRLLALSSGYPASYTEVDLRILFKRMLASCLKP